MAAVGMMLCSSSPCLLEMDGPNQQQQRFRLKGFFNRKHPEEQKYFCEAAVKAPALGMFWGRLERSVSTQERCRQGRRLRLGPVLSESSLNRGVGVCIQTLAYNSAVVPVPAEGLSEVGQAGGRAPGLMSAAPGPVAAVLGPRTQWQGGSGGKI